MVPYMHVIMERTEQGEAKEEGAASSSKDYPAATPHVERSKGHCDRDGQRRSWWRWSQIGIGFHLERPQFDRDQAGCGISVR